MIVNPKKDCPHAEKINLFDIEQFKQIQFGALKCQNCQECKELWICLICGKIYCSRKIKGHFVEHNKTNPEHCLYLGTKNLNIWCFECINDNQNDSNIENQSKEVEKGSHIESKKLNEYIQIISEFNSRKSEKPQPQKSGEESEK